LKELKRVKSRMKRRKSFMTNRRASLTTSAVKPWKEVRVKW